jgi:hypothetical protein
MINTPYTQQSGARTFLPASIPRIDSRLQPGATVNLNAETVSTISRTPMKPSMMIYFRDDGDWSFIEPSDVTEIS